MNANIKMKPIFTQNQMDITFSELQEPLGHHPVIILYDEYYEEWYYVKIRSAYKKNGAKKYKLNTEIFVPKADKGLLTEDSYIDTTKIYHIKKTELSQYIGEKNVLDTSEIDSKIGLQLYNQIISNLRDVPPFCSLIKVEFNSDIQKFEGFIEYTHVKLIDKEFKNLDFNEKTKMKNLYSNIKKNCDYNLKTQKLIHGIYYGLKEERSYYMYENNLNSDGELSLETVNEKIGTIINRMGVNNHLNDEELQELTELKKIQKQLKLEQLKQEQQQQEAQKLKKTRKFKL